MKDKTIAGILAVFAGSLGVHKFYLGQPKWGILYFLFSWTGIPFLLGLAQGVHYLTMREDDFDFKYNRRLAYSYDPPPRRIEAQRPSHKSLKPYPTKKKKAQKPLSPEEMEQLRGLKGLLDDHAITEEEYNQIKSKILGTRQG